MEQESPVVKNKLDSVMARLDWLCSEEYTGGIVWDDNEHERRVKLFKSVVGIDFNLPPP